MVENPLRWSAVEITQRRQRWAAAREAGEPRPVGWGRRNDVFIWRDIPACTLAIHRAARAGDKRALRRGRIGERHARGWATIVGGFGAVPVFQAPARRETQREHRRPRRHARVPQHRHQPGRQCQFLDHVEFTHAHIGRHPQRHMPRARRCRALETVRNGRGRQPRGQRHRAIRLPSSSNTTAAFPAWSARNPTRSRCNSTAGQRASPRAVAVENAGCNALRASSSPCARLAAGTMSTPNATRPMHLFMLSPPNVLHRGGPRSDSWPRCSQVPTRSTQNTCPCTSTVMKRSSTANTYAW